MTGTSSAYSMYLLLKQKHFSSRELGWLTPCPSLHIFLFICCNPPFGFLPEVSTKSANKSYIVFLLLLNLSFCYN